MTYRITTRDGTVFMVSEADLELITAYLILDGYPPVKIEAMEPSPAAAPAMVSESK